MEDDRSVSASVTFHLKCAKYHIADIGNIILAGSFAINYPVIDMTLGETKQGDNVVNT